MVTENSLCGQPKIGQTGGFKGTGLWWLAGANKSQLCFEASTNTLAQTPLQLTVFNVKPAITCSANI